MPNAAARDPFAIRFGLLEGIWETAWPHDRIGAHRNDYEFLAKVYENIKPPSAELDLLWHGLGAKTLAMVHSHLDSITKRLQARIDGKTGDHDVWKSLAERLDNLRERAIGQAQVAWTGCASCSSPPATWLSPRRSRTSAAAPAWTPCHR